MKKFNCKLISAILLIGAVCGTFLSVEAQDSVFIVTPHKRTHLQTRTEYPVEVYFPIQDKHITDVRLDLHLQCPDKGCSDWDYSINVVLRVKKDGMKRDFQLGRMITPYSGWYNREDNAARWNHVWSWDITEYLPLLCDTAEVVMQYEGYQDGFMATTDFVFTCSDKAKHHAKRFIDVASVYYDYYPFGRPDSTIEKFLGQKTLTLPKGTKKVLARLQISGHGEDTLNAAAEFLKKSFVYVANENVILDTSVWRSDCGCNPIQPQGGTWIYNRAGWCPGTKVQEHYMDLTPFVKGNQLNLKMLFEYYNNQGLGQPGYQIANDVFFIADKDYRHQYVNDSYGAGKDFLSQEVRTNYLPEVFNLVIKTNNDAKDKYSVYESASRLSKDGIIEQVFEKKLYERSQTEPNKQYVQRCELKEGLYQISVEDEGCDGLSWWANAEQGDGYVLIYDESMSKVLEAFEPDFGCELKYRFLTTPNADMISHESEKLVMLQDNTDKNLRIIFFNRHDNETDMQIKIFNRKTKDEVLSKTFAKSNSFDETISYKDLENGYYAVQITCGDYKQTKVFIKR